MTQFDYQLNYLLLELEPELPELPEPFEDREVVVPLEPFDGLEERDVFVVRLGAFEGEFLTLFELFEFEYVLCEELLFF